MNIKVVMSIRVAAMAGSALREQAQVYRRHIDSHPDCDRAFWERYIAESLEAAREYDQAYIDAEPVL